MPIRRPLWLLACLSLTVAIACFEDPVANTSDGDDDDDTTSTGDGDGDPTGDGDGDPTGDGDGDPTGDGDGDGDGDPSGDGDGDGDGDPTGDGDGDGDDGNPCDFCDPLELCHMQTCVPAAQVIYLNFDAEGDFSYASDQPPDATINRQDLSPDFVGNALPGFEGDAFERQQILDLVRADFAELRVVVTDTRPPAGDYSMIVFTEHPSQNPNVVAMASDDCGDQNPNDVSFVFFNLIDLGHQQRANFVSSVSGQFAGLDNLTGDDSNKADIMYPFLNETDPTFTDECRTLMANAGCEFNHSIHCNNADGMQNSWAEINAAWGF